MVLCKGHKCLVQIIKKALDEFKEMSSLAPSKGKSNVYFSGVKEEMKREILEVLVFQEGKLPVRYLGVPLITTKLRCLDCKPLIDRITARIRSWTNRPLSFA